MCNCDGKKIKVITDLEPKIVEVKEKRILTHNNPSSTLQDAEKNGIVGKDEKILKKKEDDSPKIVTGNICQTSMGSSGIYCNGDKAYFGGCAVCAKGELTPPGTGNHNQCGPYSIVVPLYQWDGLSWNMKQFMEWGPYPIDCDQIAVFNSYFPVSTIDMVNLYGDGSFLMAFFWYNYADRLAENWNAFFNSFLYRMDLRRPVGMYTPPFIPVYTCGDFFSNPPSLQQTMFYLLNYGG